MEMTEKQVDRIWGEAVALYKQGFDLVFDEETESFLVEYRKQFTYLDELNLKSIDWIYWSK